MLYELLQGPETDEDDEFVQLYAKLAQSLAVFGVVGQSPSALLSLQIPGVVVPVGLNPDDPETQYAVSNLLNAAIECNYVVTLKAGLVSDVYKLILDGKETPLIELSPAEKQKLRDARHYLFDGGDPSPVFKAYLTCLEEFYAAQDGLKAAEATHENGGPDVPPEIRIRYEAAVKRWNDEGHRLEVDEALATIRQLEGRDPYVYWDALTERYKQHTMRLKNGSEFQRVDSMPRYQEWFKDELWTPFTFDERDYHRQRRSGGTGMRGRSQCCCGPAPAGLTRTEAEPEAVWADENCVLAAGPGADMAAERGAARIASGPAMLKCSIKRITILRPWMDAAVFQSRLWKWSPQSIGRGIVISTGGSVSGNKIATGALPVLPTTALLARDIELVVGKGPALDWMQARLNEGRKLRYGPFVLDRVRLLDEREHGRNGAPHAAVVGSPQIFGFIATLFGQCPNPDMSLPWPS